MFLSLLHVNVGDDPDRPRPRRKWLSDIYHVHQRLWMAFPDDARRVEDPFFLGPWNGPGLPEPKPKRREAGFLFRIERDGRPRILVQSVQRPHWQYAFQNAPYLLVAEPKVREFDPVPRRDESYRFRLLANVVKRRSIPHPGGQMRAARPLPRKRRVETFILPLPVPDPMPSDPRQRESALHARWDPWRRWLRDVGLKHGFGVVDQSAGLRMEAVHVGVRRPAKDQSGGDAQGPSVKRYNAGLFEGAIVCTEPDRLRDAVIAGVGNGKAFGFGLLSVAPLRA